MYADSLALNLTLGNFTSFIATLVVGLVKMLALGDPYLLEMTYCHLLEKVGLVRIRVLIL